MSQGSTRGLYSNPTTNTWLRLLKRNTFNRNIKYLQGTTIQRGNDSNEIINPKVDASLTHTQIQTTGTQNEKKNPPFEYSCTYLCPELVNVELKSRRSYSHVQTRTKWRFSRSWTNARQAICERHSTPKLRAPVERLRVPIVLTDPNKSQRSVSCFTRQAKSPNYEFNGRVILLGVRSPSALTSDSASALCVCSALLLSYLVRSLPQCASL